MPRSALSVEITPTCSQLARADDGRSARAVGLVRVGVRVSVKVMVRVKLKVARSSSA